MFKMSLFNSLKARTAAKKVNAFDFKCHMKNFAMQMMCRKFFFILFPAIGINLQPMPKIVFRTCFMKEKQREYVFHNRQKLNCQCPAQSKAFTCFSMQSTLRCERWLTSFDKRTALRATIHTSQREASQVTAKSRKSLLRDHEQISCTNKCLPLCAEIMQINF